jgi:hypothetical protein
LLDIKRQRLPNIRKQRQALKYSAFSTYQYFAGSPLDIFEFQCDYFPGTKAQPREKEQYCMVPTSNWSCWITSTQDLFHFFGNKIVVHASLPPLADCGYSTAEINRGLATLKQKAQERSKRCA